MFMDRKIQFVKMSALTNFIYRSNVISVKVPESYCGYWQINSKMYMQSKVPRAANAVVKETKSKDGHHLTSRHTV